ncbi:MAG: DUF885 domain-containing protein [Ignavibacteria bacterium]|nr:DUF885 domain-containing protein [Ignavibacteria bacterium]
MKIRLLLLAFLILSGCAMKKDPNAEITQLFANYKEYVMRTFPEMATYEGDHRFDDRLTDLSEKAEKAHYDSLHMYSKQLAAIDTNKLTPENKVNYELVSEMFADDFEGEKFKHHLMPLTQQDGIHIGFPQIIETQVLKTPSDYEKYFKRLRGFGKQVTDIIANMKKGMQEKLVPPKFAMEQVLTQIAAIKDVPVDSSPFMTPALQIDKSWSQSDKDRITKELAAIIGSDIKSNYQTLYDFIKNEYLPNCRAIDGVSALPDGEERYKFAIRHETTTSMTADEIFNLGMKEVTRIQALMEELKNQIGFKGTLAEFNKYLLTDTAFYYTDKQKMLDDFAAILKTMDAKLPSLFGRLPKAPYALKEMESYRTKSAPQAYYYSAPEDRSRPGYFYVNTYDLPSRPKFTMTALALHEAIPGHHLQIAVAQELTALPWVRRQMGFTAFVEGWALYAESLGYETGMYTDLYQRYGALTFEMWRACRLVVDAGLHSKNWTREQAVQFMMTHASNSELDTRSEVDRYIVWPGQALAYKIGELRIKALRSKAEKTLGTKFSITKFHDAILENGAIPLAMLEKNIEEWMKSVK